MKIPDKKVLTKEYKALFAALRIIMLEEDPIRINFGINDDEYNSEIGSLLTRINACASVDEIRQQVYEVFLYYFGQRIAGDEDRYQRIAERIWTTLQAT